MGFLNKVILLGNVTRNPEVRYIPGSGTPVAKFGLAVNRRYKSGDEYKDETLFIDISAFARLAEITGEYVTKGMPLLVEGRLTFRTWEQDGVKRSKHEIVAENIQMISRPSGQSNRSEGTASSENSQITDNYSGNDTMDENDIPF
ncbi:single-stranded DNA-binding protein [Flexistipes sp.]|uniref:single-stranded DNA-binding protein n=1 Tax=Flexistipes sp. TaxID=3088135 RepID=UPI002E1CA539|nr:single-stranded DNA-binding protein [Flexistipes sp.]